MALKRLVRSLQESQACGALLLIGDKFGCPVLPRRLSTEEFEVALKQLCKEDASLLRALYHENDLSRDSSHLFASGDGIGCRVGPGAGKARFLRMATESLVKGLGPLLESCEGGSAASRVKLGQVEVLGAAPRVGFHSCQRPSLTRFS